jgi:proline dehydrogenase
MLPPVVDRFIAGESVADALAHVRDCNADDIGVILNILGEHYDERAQVRNDADAYVGLLESLSAAGVDGCLSVKPSQLGLEVSEEFFRDTLRRVVGAASKRDKVVWIDMEDSSTTDATLDAYETCAREFEGNVGVCVQANLKRTPEDLRRLADLPGSVRLVKGAYDEPPEIAHQEKAAVDDAYQDCLRIMFEEFEGGIAVGTHDQAMIDRAIDLQSEHGTDFEIQMLMGVRSDAQRQLAAAGHDVWQYAPFGGAWLPYFWRRVRERRENLWFALRALRE